MKTIYPLTLWLLAGALFWSLPTQALASAATPAAVGDIQAAMAPAGGPGYVIGPGDVLEISVWKNSDLTKTLPVRPDGMISLPLLGEVAVAGKTVQQISETLKKQFATYMPDPVLFVSVKQVGSMLIYVIGRVNKPGMFALNSNVDVLQALAMAAGLTPFAQKDKIRIFRRQGGDTVIFDFDYEDVSEGRDLEQNITLKRGDVIVVP